MSNPSTLVDRLVALPRLEGVPRSELEWLVAHGELERHPAGVILAPKGRRIEKLWVVVSGHVAVWTDRGAGRRRVTEWLPGDVTGMLPYSRMKGPPGNNRVEEESELLAVHERHFPEMVHRCPAFTARTVHSMLDRARSFSASDLHDEKMLSLGRLAAGLAHELNNPASATVRGAKQLLGVLREAEAASRALGAAGLDDEQLARIEQVRSACAAQPDGAVPSPLEQADREEALDEWLRRHALDPRHAAALADTGITAEALDAVADLAEGAAALEAAVRWVAAGCATQMLVRDIEQAANRIYELVAAVKRFSYMDSGAGPEPVDVGAGLRDTVRVVAAKARERGAAVALDIASDLPRVHASGSELNQVWLNLIDNALDAVGTGGHVTVRAARELDRVVVRVVDDGVGIPDDVRMQVFDPFFTTKPPGQGTGLGLDIAQRLVRRYHGDITVDSQPGRTEFRVSLVVDPPATARGAGTGEERR